MINIEIKLHMNFINEDEVTTFYEGDNVICCVGDDERYTGKIIEMGTWKDTDTSEEYEAIRIETSKSAKSFSSEIIRTDDITYICKNPLAEEINSSMSKEEVDKKTFCSMLVALGYDKETVDNLWMEAKKLMDFYDISVGKVLACMLYSLSNNCSITVPLKDICGVDIKEMEEVVSEVEDAATITLGLMIKGFVDWFRKLSKNE